jgi:hypothetical protein
MNEKKYSGEMQADANHSVAKAGKPEKRFEVTFTQNRRFELKIGRRFIVFDGKNKSTVLSADEVNHPDFVQQRSYFSVREV